jgi:hypothetical protein
MIAGVSTLPFEQRACFAAGQAKSGTTLLMALLDGHPQLLVLPEETAYFPTALNKYEKHGRRAQVDYLTNEALSRVLFGGPPEWEKVDYGHFPTGQFRKRFEAVAFDPGNADKDLLVLMMETYAEILAIPLDSIVRWVEKTPANRRFMPQILERFPQASDSSRANRLGENTPDSPVFGLLLRVALASGCSTRPSCRTKGNCRNCHPLRGFGRRSGPADATPLRFPRNLLRPQRRPDSDKSRKILAGKFRD